MLRIAKSIVFGSLVLSACASPTLSQQLPEQWRAFRLNPELNAVVSPSAPISVTWTFKTGGGISSSPTLSGNTVYVASNDGRLYALDLQSGKLQWKYTAQNDLMTAPLVVDSTIIIGEGNNYGTMFDPPNYLLLGSGTNSIIGIDQTTGKQRWRWFVPGSAMPTGAVVNGAYVQHDAAGMVFALGASDGKYRWRKYLESTATMVAANNFRGNEVVTAGDYPNSVIDFDGVSGRILWRTRFSDQFASFDDCPLASDGERIYGMYLARPKTSKFSFVGYTTPGIEHAYALDGRNGRVLWDTSLGSGRVPINNSAAIPMIYSGMMYVGSAMGPNVYGIDANTGKVRWHLRAAGPMKGGFVGVAGAVYFGDLGGYLWSVDAARGTVLGRLRMKDGFNVGSPIIVGKTLIIGSKKGYVFALPVDSIRKAMR
jgi:outer membrane protein assembly factor BamB